MTNYVTINSLQNNVCIEIPANIYEHLDNDINVSYKKVFDAKSNTYVTDQTQIDVSINGLLGDFFDSHPDELSIFESECDNISNRIYGMQSTGQELYMVKDAIKQIFVKL